MHTINEFTPGTRIAVSDGAPRPPERFNRKLAAWKAQNWTGTVESVKPPTDYSPTGELTCIKDTHRDGRCVRFRFVVRVSPRVAIIEKAEA